MSRDAESLLEHDRIEEVLETAEPLHPVVVIQYPRKGLPWYLVIALIAMVSIGGFWIYHQVAG